MPACRDLLAAFLLPSADIARRSSQRRPAQRTTSGRRRSDLVSLRRRASRCGDRVGSSRPTRCLSILAASRARGVSIIELRQFSRTGEIQQLGRSARRSVSAPSVTSLCPGFNDRLCIQSRWFHSGSRRSTDGYDNLSGLSRRALPDMLAASISANVALRKTRRCQPAI